MRSYALIGVIVFAGCANTGRGADTPDGGGGGVLTIDPPAATVTVRNGAPQSVQFNALLDGKPATGARWSLDLSSLGTLDDTGKLTATGLLAGEGTVTARLESAVGTAKITVKVEIESLGAGVPADAPSTLFSPSPTSGSTEAPTIVYPLDGALMPSTVKSPDLQWEGGSAGDLYRVIATGGLATVTAYLLHDGGAFKYDWRADAATWDLLKRSAGTSPIRFTVDRVAPGQTAVYRSAARSVSIVLADVAGAIYYWDLSDGKILSITPAGREVTIPHPPPRPTDPNRGSRCVACHTVSRDGRWMATALWGGGDYGAVFDLAADLTPDPAPTVFGVDKYKTLFSTFNPDATRLLVNADTRLFLIDAKTGAELPTLGTPLPSSKAAHPTWSPDGSTIAYIANHDGGWAVDFTRGDLAVLPVTGPDTFGPTAILRAADGMANTWPSFSPDSNWIAFGRGTNSRGRNTIEGVGVVQYPGSLFLISRNGGTPVELVNANGGPGKQDSYLPNFSPFNQGGYFWLAFYSTRDYGNAQAGTKGKARRQLWVTAIDNAPAAGQDPSHVPFWLPDQSVETENMSAYWALEPSIQ
jgi:WD40 repeat protein